MTNKNKHNTCNEKHTTSDNIDNKDKKYIVLQDQSKINKNIVSYIDENVENSNIIQMR